MLLNLIKKTKVPIICIANDRQHPKMRTLANHCYDVKFQKPPKPSIVKKLVSICGQNGMKVEYNALEQLVESMGNDMRQLLNYLQMMARSSNMSLSYKQVSDEYDTLPLVMCIV